MNRIGEALCASLRERSAGASPVDLNTLTSAEWHQVAALAVRQRVAPLLYARTGLPIPAEAQTVLRNRAAASAQRALMLQAVVRQVADEAATRGISIVALKGIHLGTTVYTSAGLREMNDVDILVRPEHAEDLGSILRGMGYRAENDLPVSIALKARHHLPRFIKSGIEWEVHWRLAPPGSVPHVEPEELWSHIVPFPLRPNVCALNAEALLVHICVHAASHQLEQGLRPLCDVQAILSAHPAIQWPVVVALAHAWRGERSVALVLTLARTTLGVDVPDDVLNALTPGETASAPASLALAHALTGAGEIHDLSMSVGALVVSRGVAEKWRLIRDRVFLPEHLMAALYPEVRAGSRRRVVGRFAYLLTRHFRSVLKLSTRKKGAAREALDRRHTLVEWLRGR